MENRKTFWNDACRYGTIIGAVGGLFILLGAFAAGEQLKTPLWISLLGKAAFVVLIYLFARRRSATYGAAEGFSFGRSLAFILGMMVFAGALEGIANFVVNNFMMKEAIEGSLHEALAGVQDQLAAIPNGEDMVMRITRMFVFNPIGCVFIGVLGNCFSGLFCGLVISAFLYRAPDLSSGTNEDKNE